MPTQSSDTQASSLWPIGVTVLVSTVRYTVVRINPTNSSDPVWYSIRVNAYWKIEDLLAAGSVLPAGVECEGSYTEGDDHYFDMVSPDAL